MENTTRTHTLITIKMGWISVIRKTIKDTIEKAATNIVAPKHIIHKGNVVLHS